MRPGCVVVVGFFVAAAFWPAPPRPRGSERFTATAVNADNQPAGPVEFVIERRSTDGERQRLLDTLQRERANEWLDTIHSLPRVGYVLANEGIAGELRYADWFEGENGSERVVLATDRPVLFPEARARPDSIAPVTMIELRLNQRGEGQGKLSFVPAIPAAADQPMTLDDYDLRPVLLLSVKHERAASRPRGHCRDGQPGLSE
jgi:hypothetical protein